MWILRMLDTLVGRRVHGEVEIPTTAELAARSADMA
jgi:hypothetical protein